MYYRSQGYRYPQNMRIPINYSGNAFSDNKDNIENNEIVEIDESNNFEEPQNETVELQETTEDNVYREAETETTKKGALNASADKSVVTSSVFGGFNKNSLLSKIGSEELLILAIVFLLSDTDTDNDVIWLLLLLLFVK